MNDQSQPTPETPVTRVECPAAKDPAVRRFIIAAMLLGIGVWCLFDQKPAPADWSLTAKNINTLATYALNNLGPYVFFPVGVVFVVLGVMTLRRKLVADGSGIGYVGKERIAWDQVRELDATRLKKGFLDLRHGQDEVLTLDSWKFQNFRELVAFVEKHVPTERHKR